MILIRYHCTAFMLVTFRLLLWRFLCNFKHMCDRAVPCTYLGHLLKSDLAIAFLELLLLKMGFLARSGLQLR
jgi:hypothetical protein